MDNVNEFSSFLEKEVNLNPNRLVTLHKNVKDVREFLSQNLDSFVKVEQQGSYALKTIIKPHRGDEYDADILVYMRHAGAKKPADYHTEVLQCFKKSGNFREKAKPKNRSIMLEYPGDFRLDVVPCITRGDSFCVCNSHKNEFEPTDGTAYRDWFNSKTDITSGHIKSVTRLLKYINAREKDWDLPSILLTTFIGNNVHANECSPKARAKFNTIPNTLLIVSKRINAFLQHTRQMPRMRNPKLKSERFTHRCWNQSNYTRFKESFSTYYRKMHNAYHEPNPERSLQKWREVFGPNFGK